MSARKISKKLPSIRERLVDGQIKDEPYSKLLGDGMPTFGSGEFTVPHLCRHLAGIRNISHPALPSELNRAPYLCILKSGFISAAAFDDRIP